MIINTKNGRVLHLNPYKWRMIDHWVPCTIVDSTEDQVLLENSFKDRFSFPKHLLEANWIRTNDNKIKISLALYSHYFLDQFKEQDADRFFSLFSENKPLVFKNRDLVLTKPEYFLLKLGWMSFGFVGFGYGERIDFTLGELFESFESGKHIYYDTFMGYNKMYLVNFFASIGGTQIHSAIFWSDDTHELVKFKFPKDFPPEFPEEVRAFVKEYQKGYKRKYPEIDRKEEALTALLNEIHTRNG